MYIHEAISRARPERDYVYRRAWLESYVLVRKVLVTNAAVPMYYECAADDHTSGCPWSPAPEDLLANDWEVYRPYAEGQDFFKKYLGRWNLCVH